MIFTYFYKRAYILLTLSLSLMQAADCSQQQSGLASLYNQQLSTKQKQLIGSAAVVSLGLILAILYLKRTKSSTKPPKDTDKSQVKSTASATSHMTEQSNSNTDKSSDNNSNEDNNNNFDDNTGDNLKENRLSIETVQKNASTFYGKYYENIETLESHKVEWTEDTLASFKDAKVLVPQYVEDLIINFITLKKEHGTEVEQLFYKENFSDSNENSMVQQFIERLLKKRPLLFTDPIDNCILDGTKNEERNNHNFFKNLTKDKENIKDFITYDEMQISALLGVWTPTAVPCNTGKRNNFGKKQSQEEYYNQPVGFAGLVGCRFEVNCLMEWQHIIVDKDQNVSANRYGPIEYSLGECVEPKGDLDTLKKDIIYLLQIWAKFYGIGNFPLFDGVKKELEMQEQSIEEQITNDDGEVIGSSTLNIWHSEQKINPILSKNEFIPMFNYNMTKFLFFNVVIYKKRMEIIIKNYIDTVLYYHKTIHPDQKVLFYMPGLGTGAWGSIKIEKSEYQMLNQTIDTPQYNHSTNFFNTNLLLQCLQIDIYFDLINNVYKHNDQIYGFELGFFGFSPDKNKESINKNYDVFCKHSLLSNRQYVDQDNYQSRIFTYDTKKLIISQRNPFDLLSHIPEKDRESIYLATVFPWDSNAPVGNEGVKCLHDNSGDPAAACSIPYGYYVLNPAINSYVLHNMRL